jgi:hypothetical protein
MLVAGILAANMLSLGHPYATSKVLVTEELLCEDLY